MARHVLVLAVAAEARHPRDDETRVVFQERCGGQTEAFQDAGAVGVDENIGMLEKGEEEGVGGFVTEV